MRLLVVRCLAFVVVQPETMARVNAGALCVLRAEQKTLSKRRQVEPFTFRLSARFCVRGRLRRLRRGK